VICLKLPEAYEEETWGSATFRVGKKIFAMAADHDGRGTVCMKTLREDQQALLSQGDPFFYPSYVGPKGWIGVAGPVVGRGHATFDIMSREAVRAATRTGRRVRATMR
jgi:hypothetical protein